MERLGNWLSPQVTHALGWALIHSVWQCLAVVAVAAGLMVICRRPNIRYLVALSALVLTLAAPVATFFVLMKPPSPVLGLLPGGPASLYATIPSPPVPSTAASPYARPVAALSSATSDRAIAAMVDSAPRFPRPDILPWLVGAWLCGVVLLSLRLAGGFLLLEQRWRSQSGALSPRILAMCQEVQRQLGLDRAVHYLECNWLQTPAVVGWLRPIVFLPVSALTGLSEAELRAVIAHELAHIRRFDAFANLFQILTETLFFYHPAIWWLNRRIRADRELCCDEIAVSITGNRLEYAHALTRIAEWKNTPFLVMAANRGSLSDRIFHILGRDRAGAGQRMLGLTGSVLFLAAALGAANALFGIAYPIPAAQAKASIKAVLVSSQAAVHEIAQRVLERSTPSQAIRINPIDLDAPRPAGARAIAVIQPAKLAVPPTDPSRLVPQPTLITPTVEASNTPSAGPTNGETAMRKTLTAAASLALLAGASQTAAQSTDTATGAHDPDALTCDAPQLVPLAKAVGWRICIQNSLVATLNENGTLNLGGVAVKSYSDLPISEQPTGEGDPNAVACQEPQLLTGARSRGPIACAHNAFWAKLAAGGCVLTPSARAIIYSPTSKKWNTGACRHMKGRNGWLPQIFF